MCMPSRQLRHLLGGFCLCAPLTGPVCQNHAGVHVFGAWTLESLKGLKRIEV